MNVGVPVIHRIQAATSFLVFLFFIFFFLLLLLLLFYRFLIFSIVNRQTTLSILFTPKRLLTSLRATMPRISSDDFQNSLEAAVHRRHTTYHNYYSFHFRWDDDTTNAKRDATSFKDLVHYLGFPKSQEYVISQNAQCPAFVLLGRLIGIIDEALNKEGRTILMIHYAGHGRENENGEPELHNEGRKKTINAARILSMCADDALLELDQPIDIVFIFGCCYSFLSTRSYDQESRTLEILAGNDERDPIAFAAGTANSFTSKLLVEIRTRVQNGHASVEMADVIDALQTSSPKKKPSYVVKLGRGSATIPLIKLPTTSTNISEPSVATPGMHATFSIRVSHVFSDDELKDLVKWLYTASRTGESLRLESIKATEESKLFILEGSRLSFFRITGLPEISLICEHKPVDYSWLLHPTPTAVIPEGLY